MVSNTAMTRVKRSNKLKKAGKRRKAANNNKGTTPKFSIHPEKIISFRETLDSYFLK